MCLLEHSIYELFDDPTTINTLLLKTLFIEKHNLVLLSEILMKALIKGIQKLISSSNCNY